MVEFMREYNLQPKVSERLEKMNSNAQVEGRFYEAEQHLCC